MGETICVTGLGGRLGSILQEGLAGEFDLVALNRRRVPGVPTLQVDIRDPAALTDQLAGVDAVVHLAGYPFSDDNWSEILPTNISGTYHVLEAARRASVRRFVFGSSLAVVAGHLDDVVAAFTSGSVRSQQDKVAYLQSLPYPRVDSLYGASKVFGETLCQLYAEQHGFSCVSLRIAEVRPDDQPNPEDPLGGLKFCCQQDFVQAVRRSIQRTRRAGHAVITAISSHD